MTIKQINVWRGIWLTTEHNLVMDWNISQTEPDDFHQVKETNTNLDNILKHEDWAIVSDLLDLTDEDSGFEEEHVSLPGLALGIRDGEPVVGEQPTELVDVTTEPFDARDELVVSGSVRDTEEEF